MTDIRPALVRSAGLISSALIGAAALRPALERPEVIELASGVVRVCILSGGAAVLVLGVGRVWTQLTRWERSLPPRMPMSEAVQFATTHAGPVVSAEVALVDHADRTAPQDESLADRYYRAVIRFAVIGSARGDFGWERMCAHVDRAGWDQLTAALVRARVLRKGSGKRPTNWAAGWDTARLRGALRLYGEDEPGGLALPAPAVIPEVRW